jgi:hypothetical protein
VIIIRGTARIIAATAGLLLVYGYIFALEGMTTRLPISSARELAGTSLWTAPWMLLFCSGLEDLTIAARKDVVLWTGIVAALVFLYYFDRYTSLSLMTKVAAPPIAVGAGVLPHFVRQIRFLFVLSSVAAGLGGAFVLYYATPTLLSRNMHFATKFIGLLIVTFCLASILAAVVAVSDVYRNVTARQHTQLS